MSQAESTFDLWARPGYTLWLPVQRELLFFRTYYRVWACASNIIDLKKVSSTRQGSRKRSFIQRYDLTTEKLMLTESKCMWGTA